MIPLTTATTIQSTARAIIALRRPPNKTRVRVTAATTQAAMTRDTTSLAPRLSGRFDIHMYVSAQIEIASKCVSHQGKFLQEIIGSAVENTP